MLTIKQYKIYNNVFVGIKFGLAASISLLFANKFSPNDLLSVCFITVLCLQPNLYRSIKSVLSQFYATLIATITTSLVVFLFYPIFAQEFSIFIIGISMALVIIMCINLNLADSTAIALFSVVYLSTMPHILEVSYWDTIHLRFLTILIGISVAMAINYLASLVRTSSRFYLLINNLFQISRNCFMEFEEYLTEIKFNNVNDNELLLFKKKIERIFATISELNIELSEIESELKYNKFKTNIDQKTVYYYTRIISRIHNIMHYIWNIINTMSFYQISEEYEKEIKYIITTLSLQYRKVSKKAINPKKIIEDINDDEKQVLDYINSNKEKILQQGGETEENLNLINVFIDLQQIEFNVNRLNELVGVKRIKN
jgi:uncharacterized membrane protein YgaE (UPF0421/DUF939 family)